MNNRRKVSTSNKHKITQHNTLKEALVCVQQCEWAAAASQAALPILMAIPDKWVLALYIKLDSKKKKGLGALHNV